MNPVCKIFLTCASLVLPYSGWGQEIEGSAVAENVHMINDSSLTDRNHYLDSDIPVDGRNIPIEKNQYYFPYSFFPTIKHLPAYKDSTSILQYEMWGQDGDTTKVYGECVYTICDTPSVTYPSRHLRAFNEPLLFNRETDKETYRFTWLRTFHKPICIRIEKYKEKYTLYCKVRGGRAGYHTMPISVVRKRSLRKEDWEKFQGFLDSLDYWNQRNDTRFYACDGSTWVLEGSTPNRYQVLSVESPGESSSFYKACDFLIELTGLSIFRKY